MATINQYVTVTATTPAELLLVKAWLDNTGNAGYAVRVDKKLVVHLSQPDRLRTDWASMEAL